MMMLLFIVTETLVSLMRSTASISTLRLVSPENLMTIAEPCLFTTPLIEAKGIFKRISGVEAGYLFDVHQLFSVHVEYDFALAV